MEIGSPCHDPLRRSLEDVTIELDDEGLDQVVVPQHTLVGKIITDKLLHRGSVKNMLLKAWGDFQEVQIAEVGYNMLLFSFNNEEEVKDVLTRAPWFVMNKLISIQRWNPHVAMNDLKFNMVQFWVQLQNLPLELLTV